MIIVRDVFSIKFGRAREVKSLMQEAKSLLEPARQHHHRAMFDLVGPAYTMVWESTFKNLAEFEAEITSTFGRDEWNKWYQQFVPLIERSYREIFTLMD